MDTPVPRYAHNEVVEPRQCGFVGTTNQDAYLHDPTGNRRFWPHRTGKINARELLRDRGQLWAEIVAAYRNGEHWWPKEDFEARVIQPEQAARYDADAWTPLVETYLATLAAEVTAAQAAWDQQPPPKQPPERPLCAATLIDVFRKAIRDPYDQYRPELPPERFDRTAQIRVREILQNLGWRRGSRANNARLWVRQP